MFQIEMNRDHKSNTFLIYLILIGYILGCDSKKESESRREISLPTNLEVIEIDSTRQFEESWFDKRFKVVVFIKNAGPHSTLNLDWEHAISEFQQISFLFFVSEKDSTKLVNHLKEVGFQHPVIYDPNEEFRKLNVRERELTFISYLVKDGRIVGLGNPSIPDFKAVLTELTK
jgi:hypothetical protein